MALPPPWIAVHHALNDLIPEHEGDLQKLAQDLVADLEKRSGLAVVPKWAVNEDSLRVTLGFEK